MTAASAGLDVVRLGLPRFRRRSAYAALVARAFSNAAQGRARQSYRRITLRAGLIGMPFALSRSPFEASQRRCRARPAAARMQHPTRAAPTEVNTREIFIAHSFQGDLESGEWLFSDKMEVDAVNWVAAT